MFRLVSSPSLRSGLYTAIRDGFIGNLNVVQHLGLNHNLALEWFHLDHEQDGSQEEFHPYWGMPSWINGNGVDGSAFKAAAVMRRTIAERQIYL